MPVWLGRQTYVILSPVQPSQGYYYSHNNNLNPLSYRSLTSQHGRNCSPLQCQHQTNVPTRSSSPSRILWSLPLGTSVQIFTFFVLSFMNDISFILQREHGWRTMKRPGIEYFIGYLSQFYEIVVFTSQYAYVSISSPSLQSLREANLLASRSQRYLY